MLEWVAYHQSIGFDHFIINTNDCSDGTDRIARRLQELGIATHIENPGPWANGPQGAAYDNAMAHPKLAEAEWILVSDADEFLNIKTGDGTLDALFAAAPEANLFSFTWQLFGHNGIVEFRDELVTEQFTRAAHPYQQWPSTLRAIKTLYRADAGFKVLSTHRPKKLGPKTPGKYRLQNLKWVDGDGDDMTAAFAHYGWRSVNLGPGFGDDLARMHHYAVRSINSYLMKRVRGDVRTAADHKKLEKTGIEYWKLHCWNSVENNTINRHADRTRTAFNRFLADEMLGRLHEKAVHFHMDKSRSLAKSEMAQAFTDSFRNHVGTYEWASGHDVVSCPDLALDRSKFDPDCYLDTLKTSRQLAVNLARKHRRLPWFANLDVTGVRFSGSNVPDDQIPETLRPIGPEQIAKAEPTTFHNPPKRRKMREQILKDVGKSGKTWALMNTGDPEIIRDLINFKKPEKLFVINPWGYDCNRHTIPPKQRRPDPRQIAQELAFAELLGTFEANIKSGQLSIYRADPYYALKTLPHGFLDAAFISGAMSFERGRNLLRKTVSRLSDGGILVLDSYHRRGRHGDGILRATHGMLEDHAAFLRIQALEGAHCAIKVLDRGD